MSIDITYYSFSPSRADKRWATFTDDYKQVKAGVSHSPKNIYTIVSDLKENREEFLLEDFVHLDLEYGAVQCNPIENGSIEYPVIEIIAKMKGFSFGDGYLTKEDWIKVYENLDKGFIKKFIRSVEKEFDWTQEEADELVMELLKNVRAVVVDFKRQADSFYVYEVNGVIAPGSFGDQLQQRAQKHYETFKDVLE